MRGVRSTVRSQPRAGTRRPSGPPSEAAVPPLASRRAAGVPRRRRVAQSLRSSTAPSSAATSVIFRMSRFRTCAISWAITPWSSSRFIVPSRPVVTAIEACSGSRPVANAFGIRLVDQVDPRHRQAGRDRHLRDDVHEPLGLGGGVLGRYRPREARGEDGPVAEAVADPRRARFRSSAAPLAAIGRGSGTPPGRTTAAAPRTKRSKPSPMNAEQRDEARDQEPRVAPVAALLVEEVARGRRGRPSGWAGGGRPLLRGHPVTAGRGRPEASARSTASTWKNSAGWKPSAPATRLIGKTCWRVL